MVTKSQYRDREGRAMKRRAGSADAAGRAMMKPKTKVKKKKKQGYKARKDESIAMRIRKKRTKKQLKASRDESYGKFGRGTGIGKINK